MFMKIQLVVKIELNFVKLNYMKGIHNLRGPIQSKVMAPQKGESIGVCLL